MPVKEFNTLVEEYYEKVKDKYPDLDFSKFSKICKAPFEFIKRCIRNDNLPIILIKYFGKIRVYSGRLDTLTKKYTFAASKGYITKEELNQKLEFISNYREKLKQFDERFSKEVEIIDDLEEEID